MKRVLLTTLKIAIAAGLLYLIFLKVPFGRVWDVMRHIRRLNLLYAFLLSLSVYALFVWRWYILLNAQGIKISYFRAFLFVACSFFLNNVLPASVGMDVVRSAYAGGKRHFSEAFATTITDRIAGLTGLLTLGVLPIFTFQRKIMLLPAIYLGGLLIIFVFVILMFNLNLPKLKRWILSVKFFGIGKFIQKLYNALMLYKGKKKILLYTFLISLLLQFTLIYENYVLTIGMGFHIPLIYFFLYIPLTGTVSMIPISINGLGLREAAYIFLFSSAGLAKSGALSISLMFFGIGVFTSLIGGPMLPFVKSIESRRIEQ